MSERLRLLLLIPHLGGGGAERVVAHLAQSLDAQRFEVHLGLIMEDGPGAEQPPPWVQIHRFGCKRVREGWRQLLRLVWNLKPDLVLGGMAHLNFATLLLRPFFPGCTRVVVRQNTTASVAARGSFERACYRFLYPRADAIVCQSEAMARDLAERFAVRRELLHVLNNPVDLNARRRGQGKVSEDGMWAENAFPRLLCAGRLSREKGFDLLLAALHGLLPRYPLLHAIVLGEGTARLELERMQEALGLTSAVSLPGYRREWANICDDADLFVLPSRFEGMPNALLEAAAEGLPLVATPCSGGVTELLEGVPGAWLASSISAEGLKEAIAFAVEILGDPKDDRARFDFPFLMSFERGFAVAGYGALFEQICQDLRPASDA